MVLVFFSPPPGSHSGRSTGQVGNVLFSAKMFLDLMVHKTGSPAKIKLLRLLKKLSEEN